MNNKIIANSWTLNCFPEQEKPFYCNIEYYIGEVRHTKSCRFVTYEEAYKWIEDQAVI